MTEERTPRDVQERDSDVRPSDSWSPASVIPDPTPQDGWVFRWVRTSILGQSDGTHTSRMFREGWEPVKATDHPEISMVTIEQERFRDNVVIGGLLLCKAPFEMVDERNEYFQNQTDSQMSSVDNNLMRENDPRMPLFNDRKTKVTFGKGT